jgi:hypothetical protein
VTEPLQISTSSTAALQKLSGLRLKSSIARQLGDKSLGLTADGQAQILEAGIRSGPEALFVGDSLLEKLADVDLAALVRRLSPHLTDQLAVEGLASPDGGLGPGEQANIISAGLSNSPRRGLDRGSFLDLKV